MLSTNASDMVWLSSQDIHNDLDGVIAEYAERFRESCPRRTASENEAHYRPQSALMSGERPTESEDLDCMSQRLKEMQEERRRAQLRDCSRGGDGGRAASVGLRRVGSELAGQQAPRERHARLRYHAA